MSTRWRGRASTKNERKRLPVADQICKGLEEAILHTKGEIALKTTTLEMPDRPPEVGAEELSKLRLKSGMSQYVFARMLNVSTKTVQSWEQGTRKPSKAALRLIQSYRQNPSCSTLSGCLVQSPARAVANRPRLVVSRASLDSTPLVAARRPLMSRPPILGSSTTGVVRPGTMRGANRKWI
jgi:putative transcriptional regulator